MESLPPWSLVQALLLSVVLPAFAVAAALLAAVAAITRSEAARLIGAAAALAAGVAAGNFSGSLLPWWPLERGWPGLLPATMVAVAGGIFASLLSSHGNGYWSLALRLMVMAGCAWWLAPVATPTSSSHRWASLFLFAAASLNWEVYRLQAGRCLGRGALPTVVIPWGAAAAAVLIHAHSARFCDVAVLVSTTLVAIGLIAAIWKLDTAPIFAAPAIFFPALMLNGADSTFGDVPFASFTLVAIAPCALWILCLPPVRRALSDRALAITATIAILIPCAVAIILAARAESLDFGY